MLVNHIDIQGSEKINDPHRPKTLIYNMLSDLKYLALTLVLIIAVGCSVKNNDEPFAVSGHVENVEDGYMILFFKSNLDGSTTTIAIDTLKNGRFEFSAPAETGVQYHVIAP